MTEAARRSSPLLTGLLAAAAILVPLVFSITLEETFAVPKLIALGAVLVVGAALIAATARQGVSFTWRLADAVALVYVLAVVVSFVTSVDRSQSLWGERLQRQGLAATLIYVCFYFLARVAITDRTRLLVVFRGVAIGATAVAGYAVVQQLGLDPLWQPPVGGRTFSTIGQPNSLGAYLAVAVPLTLALAASRGPVGGSLWAGAAALQTVGLVTTASRGAVVALALGLLTAVTVGVAASVRRGGRLLVAVAVAAASVTVAVVWVAPVRSAAGELVSRIMAHDLDLADQSQTHRDLWRVAGRIAVDHPLLGTGPDTFALVFPAYRDAVLEPDRAEMLSRHRVESPHNVYLAIASGSGIPALATYLLLIGMVLVAAIRSSHVLGAGVAGAIVGHLASNFFITAELAGSFLFWMLVGAAVAGLAPAPSTEPAEYDSGRLRLTHP